MFYVYFQDRMKRYSLRDLDFIDSREVGILVRMLAVWVISKCLVLKIRIFRIQLLEIYLVYLGKNLKCVFLICILRDFKVLGLNFEFYKFYI